MAMLFVVVFLMLFFDLMVDHAEFSRLMVVKIEIQQVCKKYASHDFPYDWELSYRASVDMVNNLGSVKSSNA